MKHLVHVAQVEAVAVWFGRKLRVSRASRAEFMNMDTCLPFMERMGWEGLGNGIKMGETSIQSNRKASFM